MKLICVCWKTSRNAKASHFGRGVCGADGEGKDAAKEPDTQRYAPCLSEPSYRNAAGVISPGLPSQALTRQLPQSGSPWQRGFVFDKTDLRLPENVTECQSLPLSGEVARRSRDGEVVQSSTCVIPLTLKESLVQPLSLAAARQPFPFRHFRATSPGRGSLS